MECIFVYLYAGEEVLKKIGYKTRSRKVFNLGTTGLDFFYTENKGIEKLFHDEKAEDFAKSLLRHSGGKTLDYALGYTIHIYTAIEMYPMLMRFAKNNFDEYMRLSLAFDKMLAEKVYNISIEKVNLASKINLGDSLPEELNVLLKTATKEVYGEADIDFNKAYEKFIYFLTLTCDPFLVKRMIYPFIKYISKFDIYKFTYPIFLKNIPENFYEKINESLQKGIENSTKGLLKLINSL